MIHSRKPDLSWEIGADYLHGVLRADQIRTNTLVQLVQHWHSDPDARDEVIAALDALADVVTRARREGELDAAVEQVEDVAGMDSAQVEVDMRGVRRLLEENREVERVTGRFSSRGAREIRHPSMKATRQHLAEQPLPGQQDRRRSA